MCTGTGTGSGRTICPACRRGIDRYPGGYLLIQGGYWQGRWEEILNLVKKQEEARRTGPLHRILWIEPKDGEVTAPNLARRLGKAVQPAHSPFIRPKGNPWCGWCEGRTET